uniref:Uncharacterized protein n=1 Tax=Fagus sylvatica TaxID=28930 RepID=A0A2N9FTU8_FAGSY
MKQKEEEWVEYQNIMEDVIKRSGLDNINGQLGRSGNVNSVTLQGKIKDPGSLEFNPSWYLLGAMVGA